jgi:hypothetical protein
VAATNPAPVTAPQAASVLREHMSASAREMVQGRYNLREVLLT